MLKLQNRVKNAHDKMIEKDGQVVVYGKPGHAEVIGLTGQTMNQAKVVMVEEDLEQIDFTRPVTLFSQTTKSTAGFYGMRSEIERRIQKEGLDPEDLITNDSICRQVSNREPQLTRFSEAHDVILFVSGKKSSNGRALYGVCKDTNPKSYFIENCDDINLGWFGPEDKVGICGATSTPLWLMKDVASFLAEQSTK